MKSKWSDEEVKELKSDLDLRVYTSNLLGLDDELVLHGGGNTSLKSKVNGEDILFVKGSGWDLSNIKKEGFAPVKLDALLEMAKLKELSDSDMVASQKSAMLDKTAPNPSVEAILHALIPYKYVDHTHADAVVTISNSKDGEKLISEIFPNFLLIPYVMPGFMLARTIYERTRDFDWATCDGIILLNHGIFTFDDDAKNSYEKMINAVSKAELFLKKYASFEIVNSNEAKNFDTQRLQKLVSEKKGYSVVLKINQSPLARFYASQENLYSFATRGVLTPEHIIRTKRVPLVVENGDIKQDIERFIDRYIEYFKRFAKDEICLNPAPNYAVIKNFGVISFGKSEKEANVIYDIIEHTMRAVLRADRLGGYVSISKKDSFDMEYWELEQAKLK